jgi:hypothetical protein
MRRDTYLPIWGKASTSPLGRGFYLTPEEREVRLSPQGCPLGRERGKRIREMPNSLPYVLPLSISDGEGARG